MILVLDTIKTCKIYHANEQLQSQRVVCIEIVTRANHVSQKSVSTFPGINELTPDHSILPRLSAYTTQTTTFWHENFIVETPSHSVKSKLKPLPTVGEMLLLRLEQPDDRYKAIATFPLHHRQTC